MPIATVRLILRVSDLRAESSAAQKGNCVFGAASRPFDDVGVIIRTVSSAEYAADLATVKRQTVELGGTATAGTHSCGETLLVQLTQPPPQTTLYCAPYEAIAQAPPNAPYTAAELLAVDDLALGVYSP